MRVFYMDGDSWLSYFILFLLLIFSAYFACAETAFSSARAVRIKTKADDGDKRAKNAVFISSNFDKALTTLLIGNNITHIAAASVATLIATRIFGTSGAVSVVCTVVTTLIVFLFSEMIPKAYANDNARASMQQKQGACISADHITKYQTTGKKYLNAGKTTKSQQEKLSN